MWLKCIIFAHIRVIPTPQAYTQVSSFGKRLLVPEFNPEQSAAIYSCEAFIKQFFMGVNILRIERGLSWAEFYRTMKARGLQYSPNTYKKFRNGTYKTIGLFNLIFIADYFGKSFIDVYNLGADQELK